MGNNDKEFKSIPFNKRKENIICSLTEVNSFLCNLKRASKYINLYKFLK